MLKKLDVQINKLLSQKTSAENNRDKYAALVDECDNKLKKLQAIRKKYEQLENDLMTTLENETAK